MMQQMRLKSSFFTKLMFCLFKTTLSVLFFVSLATAIREFIYFNFAFVYLFPFAFFFAVLGNMIALPVAIESDCVIYHHLWRKKKYKVKKVIIHDVVYFIEPEISYDGYLIVFDGRWYPACITYADKYNDLKSFYRKKSGEIDVVEKP